MYKFEIFKLLFLNYQQSKSLDFIQKINAYDLNKYEVLVFKKQIIEKELVEYYSNALKSDELNDLDGKLLNIINNDIRKLL